MASLASTAVVVNDWWTEAGVNGKRHIAKRVTLTLTGQGGTSNKILASVLGLNKLLDASCFVKADGSAANPAAVSADQSTLYLLDVSTTLVPTDITGTYTGVVKGY